MSHDMHKVPGFLLTMPDYDGSLAAVRSLGARGIPVYVAVSKLLAPAAWSRHVAERYSCPPTIPSAGLLEWLLEFGKRYPGHVLYPTSDDLVWLSAANEGELRRYYRLYSPALDVMRRLLDKKALYEASDAVGIATLPTAFPAVDAEVETAALGMRHPVLIKPRTQALLLSKLKGAVVSDSGRMLARYREFMNENRYDGAIVQHLPDVSRPMLQEYAPGAADSIYSLSGFCDEGGAGFVVRASVKVLQWPRRVGVGICFENAPVDRELAESVRRFCRHVGYFGAFEAEFVGDEHGRRMIDFNPRFFGQMGFDEARGLPTAYLVYLAAQGNREALAQAVDEARAWRPEGPHVYVNRVALQSALLLERLLMVSSADEVRRWDRWQGNGVRATDAIEQAGDPLPGLVAQAERLLHAMRHPRSVLRSARRGADACEASSATRASASCAPRTPQSGRSSRSFQA